MSRIKRRQFLQFSGSALGAIGLNQLDLKNQANRYSRVLERSTNRKLALLVGVNQYPDNIPSLQGCLTDVEMQQELLIHRYGFNPADIMTVTDNSEIKPTRSGILEAFEEHLIKQAKPGDVVVFHYSGHGSQVIDSNPIPEFGELNGTMVAYDARSELANETGVGDIMGKTLFLLMYALPTDNVTVVLDSCHSGGGVRGNYRFRAIPSRLGSKNKAKPSEIELAYQEQWLSRLKLSQDKLGELRRKGIAKGVALGSARANQLATDAPFDGFHAGAFTYQLTRYLWQQPRSRSLGNVFVHLARSTHDLAESNHLVQEPIYQVQPDSNYEEQPVYFLESDTPAAEAVLRKVDGKKVEFWLGGIASQSLEAFKEGAIFNFIDSEGKVQGEITQTSRVGLVGYGTVKEGNPEEGMFLREQVRGVPADLKLRLGLDPSLGLELEAAKSTLQSVNRVETMTVNQQLTVDYLLGRMTEEALAQANQTETVNPPPVSSIGLFTPGLAPVEDSFGKVGESIELAVQRLRPRLKMLLANRILSLLANGNSSSIKVEATVQLIGGRGIVGSFGSRSAETAWQNQRITSTLKQLDADSEIEIKINNKEERDLYVGVLVINSNGDIVVLHPTDWNSPEEAARLANGTTMIVPQKTGNPDDFSFIVRGPSGFFELLVLASTKPISNALKGLQQIARGRGARSGNPLALGEDEPVNIMDALLGDLDRNSRTGIDLVRGRQTVDAEQLAALSTIIEVVE